jgi:SCY1-like protein 1
MTESANWNPANGPSTTTQANAAQGGGSRIVGTAAAAGALAGWAISSLNRQLPSNEAHSQMTATPEQVQKPLEIPRQASMIFNSTAPSPAATPRASFGDASRPSATSPRLGQGSRLGALSAKSGGMQLGGSSRSKQQHQSEGQSLVDALAAEYEEDEVGSVRDAWGDGDLMDVNADADDWSESYAMARRDLELMRNVSFCRRL